MRITHIATELSPLAKVGGLGDVVSGLSKSILNHKMGVEVFLPFYAHIDKTKLENLKIEQKGPPTIWSAQFEEIPLILIESPYFKGQKIYGEKNDLSRFLSFCCACLDYLLKRDKPSDILHLHDWMTAFIAPLYYEIYRPYGLKIGKVITTIHNAFYQGKCSPKKLKAFGFPSSLLYRFADPKKTHVSNLLKGAILYSDSLTTVSPSYAQEIQKERFNLSSSFITHKDKLEGILNGIEVDYWNPQTDPYLHKQYPSSFADLQKVVDGKKENKKELSTLLKLETSSSPLISCVTRLVKQKGPDLIRYGIDEILKKGGQFVLLGSSPEKKIQKQFSLLKKKYQNNPNVHFRFEFNEALAHLIFAASDMTLIPSLFEPCGLTQIIAMRYGTIPIVHSVGGLKDTVFEGKNGFTFNQPKNGELNQALDRAFQVFNHNLSKWQMLMKNALSYEGSWSHSSLEYLKLYQN